MFANFVETAGNAQIMLSHAKLDVHEAWILWQAIGDAFPQQERNRLVFVL